MSLSPKVTQTWEQINYDIELKTIWLSDLMKKGFAKREKELSLNTGFATYDWLYD